MGVLIGMAVIAMYLVPTIIAAARNHHQAGPIVLINILFGWSLIGWGAALIWSTSKVKV